ncbi:MAG TPA: MerR family transcriptional regulator [Micromonosporaceae bacterium]
MRIRELSRRSGVAIPTIKYYLREGLLDAGQATAANQAEYDEAHLRRLRLIRALVEVGRVSISSARAVIDALGRDDIPPHDLLGIAHNAVAPTRRPDRDSDQWRAARRRAGDYVAERGWRVSPDAIGLDQLADTLAALESLHVTEMLNGLDAYAEAAQSIARVEVANVVARRDPVRMLELVVIGTVLGDALLDALRLLAHEHESAVQLGADRPGRPARPDAQPEIC